MNEWKCQICETINDEQQQHCVVCGNTKPEKTIDRSRVPEDTAFGSSGGSAKTYRKHGPEIEHATHRIEKEYEKRARKKHTSARIADNFTKFIVVFLLTVLAVFFLQRIRFDGIPKSESVKQTPAKTAEISVSADDVSAAGDVKVTADTVEGTLKADAFSAVEEVKEPSEIVVNASSRVLMCQVSRGDVVNQWTPLFGNSSIARDSIESVTFTDSLRKMGSGAWDVSADRDGSVMAWISGNDLYIGADGVIIAEDSCYGMFYACTALKQINGLEYLDTSRETNMKDMFTSCFELTQVDVSHFDTSNVKNMSGMFTECLELTSVDVSGFDTKNVTDMSRLFASCFNLRSIDVSGFNTSNVTNMRSMFRDCEKLTALDVSGFDVAKVKWYEDIFKGCAAGLTWEDVGKRAGTKTVTNETGSRILMRSVASGWDWTDYKWVYGNGGIRRADIKTVTFVDSLREIGPDAWDVSDARDGSVMAWVTGNDLYIGADGGVIANESCFGMFSKFESLVEINGLEFLDTSRVTDMNHMFVDCESLTSLDVSHFDTSNVENMDGMFALCYSLKELDLSNFDTSRVTNMLSMFENCRSLTDLDVSSFDTSNVVDMVYMFTNCEALLSVDVTGFDTSNVKEMDFMFYGCSSLLSVDVTGFDTSNVKEMDYMFKKCTSLMSLDVSGFKVSAQTGKEIFEECPLELKWADVGKRSGCKTLKKGTKGSNVKTLQQWLINLGYLNGKADGSFGSKTENAVMSAQKSFGLKQTGIADSELLVLLYERNR